MRYCRTTGRRCLGLSPRDRGRRTQRQCPGFETGGRVKLQVQCQTIAIVILTIHSQIIMEGAGTKDLITGSWPQEVSHHKYTTIDQWKNFAASSATTYYHPSCSCPLGSDDDPMAVLDPKLRVRGVSGLRVADTSAMPRLINGHPQMAAHAIGEKAAGMIKMDRAR